MTSWQFFKLLVGDFYCQRRHRRLWDRCGRLAMCPVCDREWIGDLVRSRQWREDMDRLAEERAAEEPF